MLALSVAGAATSLLRSRLQSERPMKANPTHIANGAHGVVAPLGDAFGMGLRSRGLRAPI
jgi:hypothetical protein